MSEVPVFYSLFFFHTVYLEMECVTALQDSFLIRKMFPVSFEAALIHDSA